jgi:hypothetical protein
LAGGQPPAGFAIPGGAAGNLPPGVANRFRGGAAGGGGGGGAGGLLNGSTPSAAMKTLLQANAGSYTWVAAAVGSNQAAGYQLATGEPVMAIGGFNGSDPTPTLAQFKQYVAAGRIHYFIGGGLGGFGGRVGPGGGTAQGTTSSTSSAISAWVTSTFTAKTVGNVTVYDLTQP